MVLKNLVWKNSCPTNFDALQTPPTKRHNTLQELIRHLRDNLKKLTRHPQNFTFLGAFIKVRYAHFIGTSWTNLQDSKISSWAEIPNLDRVWQKVVIKTTIGVDVWVVNVLHHIMQDSFRLNKITLLHRCMSANIKGEQKKHQ